MFTYISHSFLLSCYNERVSITPYACAFRRNISQSELQPFVADIFLFIRECIIVSLFIQSQKTDEITLGFYFHFLYQLDEWAGISMGLFQSVDVFYPSYRRNDYREIAALDEQGVHDEAGYSAVSIYEWMDEYEFLMCQGG